MVFSFVKASSPELPFSEPDGKAGNKSISKPDFLSRFQARVSKRTLAYIAIAIPVFLFVSFASYIVWASRHPVENVQVTNLTSNSATITWQTDRPVPGIVSVDAGENSFPYTISIADRYYDDRDVARAELEAAKDNTEQGDDSQVEADEINYDYDVKKLGNYYTHHVTLTGLDEATQYSFMVGSNIVFKAPESNTFTTKAVPEQLPAPEPAYGSIFEIDEDENEYVPGSDAMIVIEVVEKDTGEVVSKISSAVNPENGSWYADLIPASLQVDGTLIESPSSKFDFIATAYAAKGYESEKEQIFFDRKAPAPNIQVDIINPDLRDDIEENPEEFSLVGTVGAYCIDGDCGKCDSWAAKMGCEASNSVSQAQAATPAPAPANTAPANQEPASQPSAPAPSNSGSNDCSGVSCNGGSCYTGPDKNDGGYACDCEGGVRIWNGKCPSNTNTVASLPDDDCTGVSCGSGGSCDAGYGNGRFDGQYKCVCPGNDVVGGNCAKEPVQSQGIANGFTPGATNPGGVTTNGGSPNSDSDGDGIPDSDDPDYVAVDPNDIEDLDNDDNGNTSPQLRCCRSGSKWLKKTGCGKSELNAGPAVSGKSCSSTYPQVGTGGGFGSTSTNENNDDDGGDTDFPPGDKGQGSNSEGNSTANETAIATALAGGWSLNKNVCDSCPASQSGTVECNFRKVGFVSIWKCPAIVDTPATEVVEEAEPVVKQPGGPGTTLGAGEYSSKSQCESACPSNKCSSNSSGVVNGEIVDVYKCDPGVNTGEYSAAGLCSQNCRDAATNCVNDNDVWKCIVPATSDPEIVTPSPPPAEANVLNRVFPSVTDCQLSACGSQGGSCVKRECSSATDPGCNIQHVCKPNSSSITPSDLNYSGSFLISTVSAQDESLTTAEVLFDPDSGLYEAAEGGVYEFEFNGKQYESKLVSSENGLAQIFIDTNKNGRLDETEQVVAQDPVDLNLKKTESVFEYEIAAGYNFVSFPMVMSETPDASSLLDYIEEQHGDVAYSVAKFDSSWKIVGQTKSSDYNVNNFKLIPGEGYVIKAKSNFLLSLSGKEVIYEADGDNAPISFGPGWNLIGLYGTGTKDYTAESLIDAIDEYPDPDFDVNNVTRWPVEKQRYEGLQKQEDSEGTEQVYGFDFPLEQDMGYFVRVVEGQGRWSPERE